MLKHTLTIIFIMAIFFHLKGQPTGTNMGNYSTGGTLGVASTTIDVLSLFNIQQTTPNQVITVPTPTNLLAGKNITINNTGSVNYVLVPGGTVAPGTGVIIRWVGSSWSVTGGAPAASLELANTIYGGPASGANATATFRSMVSNDFPTSGVAPGVWNSITINDKGIATSGSNIAYLTGITSSQVTTALGYTPIAATRSLTINGVTQDLSTDRVWDVLNITGNAATSTALQIPRTINGQSFDGTANITIPGTAITNIPNASLTNSSFTVNGSNVSLGASTTITAAPSGTAGGALSGTYPNPVLTNSGVTAGTYNGTVTVSNKGIITSATVKTPSNVTPTLNTAFQVSTTSGADVNYSVNIQITSTLVGTNTGTVLLQVSSTSGGTYTTINQSSISLSGVVTTLANTQSVAGFIPAGMWVKLTTAATGTNAGAAVFTPQPSQQTIY